MILLYHYTCHYIIISLCVYYYIIIRVIIRACIILYAHIRRALRARCMRRRLPPRRRRRCCGPYLQRRYASQTEIDTYLRISYGDTRRRYISPTEIRAVLQCCMRRSAGGGAVASSQALRIRACSDPRPAPGRQAAIGRPASRFGQ